MLSSDIFPYLMCGCRYTMEKSFASRMPDGVDVILQGGLINIQKE
jgi:hypothetical protein